jgi:hypothetical protein
VHVPDDHAAAQRHEPRPARWGTSCYTSTDITNSQVDCWLVGPINQQLARLLIGCSPVTPAHRWDVAAVAAIPTNQQQDRL